MSSTSPREFRRAQRQRVRGTILVTDSMTDMGVGRVGNLSESGMLLIAHSPLVDDALYQFRFNLGPGASGTIEAGAHLLWQDRASAPGQVWAGFRFITLLDSQLHRLRDWLATNNQRRHA
ncbi:PilZ domain-containing protein [Marilutibacter alkalisoli]|uniref:PilZ domain-containing protein n=1 Tax=Marilutibacter alkalisoli TaxID=2591633 RepID=A0A514BP41_9GAMM|nr:PilZ domain-containing protein [Lysobacter alkalisoli]QDH69151.1 PilZ domain-containing protein [Lysobacter alkalisoli]